MSSGRLSSSCYQRSSRLPGVTRFTSALAIGPNARGLMLHQLADTCKLPLLNYANAYEYGYLLKSLHESYIK